MLNVFTPMNEQCTHRLRFNAEDVKVLKGNIHQRGLGYHATIEIDGKQYKVYGKSCGAPHCQCDAYIKEVREGRMICG